MAGNAQTEIPEAYSIGQELDWNAPWLDVQLWTELPFWLMLGNATILLEYNGHEFKIQLHDDYFELNVGELVDSQRSACYCGPVRRPENLPAGIQQLIKEHPEMSVMWRKCKTVLKVNSRCNESVWNAVSEERGMAFDLYRSELCRAHIPVINRLIQQYRISTYDCFAHDVAPWDVPKWLIERDGRCVASFLVPYRTWDIKPIMHSDERDKPESYELIKPTELQDQIETKASGGEYELLDAINLMERGDYSGAVRRVTTAIEAIVEETIRREIETAQGAQAAEALLKKTRMRFGDRIKAYGQATGRNLSGSMATDLNQLRDLRNSIVHAAYRIGPHERGRAQKAVDTGRWIYSWLENDAKRSQIRESKIARRALGRDLYAAIFSPEISPDGVVLRPLAQDRGGSK